jgi:hypothetical protein
MPLDRLFWLDAAAWRRHANPWSVWTRVATFPVIVLAGWSAHWIGWWALLPGALVLVWTYLNPRLFPAPAHFDSWASQVTLGERLWLQPGRPAVDGAHVRPVKLLTALSATGLPVVGAGVVLQGPGWTLFGTALVMLGKLWFCDRMVWLYRDARRARPELADLG